ncbi:hypothetical protein VSS74_14210 [Conexibacter stalactiti]|uniref:Secreted protein n=1 Tax=Conexibacter stalactiti TaxID=1940611 RepID=A0ABU4HRY1_9ACTN|nr:hypothetical protein [Conexibacter stalactiti]MDW5595499.1 hypothetical protein [Conexibacter stalactiti]MEC5036141.1 hypothetical protein [Conexibacter stalactiti]
MRSTVFTRPAAALAIASVALAGVAGASQAAPTVSGASVKKSSLPGNRIKPNSLTGVQINESRLGVVPVAKLASFAELAKSADSAKTAQFAENARSAETARSAENARTADVAKDAQKLNGRDHTAFLSNATRTVFVASPQIPGAGGSTTIVASCNADEKAIGGGGGWFQIASPQPTELDVQVIASVPVPFDGGNELTGWSVSGRNNSASNRILRAYVTCVPKVVG